MALTLDQRIDAARSNPTYTNTVAGALVKQAKWTLRTAIGTAGVTTQGQALATSVLNNADGYVWRFGASVLTEPTFDALTDISTLTDQQVQDTIASLWPLFTSAGA